MSAQYLRNTLRKYSANRHNLTIITAEERSFDYLNIYLADHQADILPAIPFGINVPKEAFKPIPRPSVILSTIGNKRLWEHRSIPLVRYLDLRTQRMTKDMGLVYPKKRN
ncbi:MAG: hypothetical protein WAM14_00650 [Candidatus Nitrosopolaris sp.]